MIQAPREITTVPAGVKRMSPSVPAGLARNKPAKKVQLTVIFGDRQHIVEGRRVDLGYSRLMK